MTLEAQRPGGTSFGSFVETSHILYLGHGSKFDMAIFDIFGDQHRWSFFGSSNCRCRLEPEGFVA